MNSIENDAVKRARGGWLGLIVIFVIFLIVAGGLYAFSFRENLTEADGIKIMSYFSLGLAGLVLLSWIRQGIYIRRTINTLKSGKETKCDFIVACRSNKRDYQQNVFYIKVYFYNNRNEKKVFKTRTMFNLFEVKELESKKTLCAKCYNNFVVITEKFDSSKILNK